MVFVVFSRWFSRVSYDLFTLLGFDLFSSVIGMCKFNEMYDLFAHFKDFMSQLWV